MATIIEKVHLVKADPVNNNNKKWVGTLFDNGDVLCEWGRVGDTGQSKMFSGAGKSFLDKKVNEKKRDGRNGEIAYREVPIIDGPTVTNGSANTKNVGGNKLVEIAKKQIQTGSNPTTIKLIERFVKANAHQISTLTGGQITYNYDKGLFQTPMGIVGQINIDEARKKLVDIGDLVAEHKYGNNLLELTRDYLMLVPQDTGRNKLVLDSFWADLVAVQKQTAILDGLQASLSQVTSGSVKAKPDKVVVEEQVFDCKIDLVEDESIIRRIKKAYTSTRRANHQSRHLDVKQVYSVCINVVREAFNKDGAKLQNCWDLWHGTRVSNILSILKSGLIIPPSSSAHCTGRMYGNGVYASDISTKALNYASGYWSGSNDDNPFMFLVKFGMGNYYVPRGSFSSNSAPKGYDSTFAKEGQSGVINNEMIVYRVGQVDLQFLVEFSPNGK